MSRQYAAPQSFSAKPRLSIALQPVDSSQIKAIGYDPATQTLAVTFTRGAGAVYHYPNVLPETYQAFKDAESLGKFFGKHIQPLAFEKYPAEPDEPEAQAA